MKHKKIFAVVCALVLIICFFAGLPEEQMSAESSGSLSDVAGVYIDADYSTCTLTAVLTDADGNDIYVEDENISYAWYKSSDGMDGSYDKISGETGSTLGASFIDGYYYKVEVTVSGGTSATYTSEVKYITTEISSVKIQNDIYRDDVLTALLLNSEGDVLYYDADGNSSVPTATPTSATPSDATTYNSSATYTWYCQQATNTYVYTDEAAPDNTDENYVDITTSTGMGTASANKLTPVMGTIYYYYYVKVSFEENSVTYTYSSDPRIADIYTGVTVEIEQVKVDNSNDITLNMIVYDDNGDVMLNEDGSYYYNSAYTTTWYKSKEYFASTGDGTTADENSKVTTSATIPLGYAPQDYYANSNYMRVTNAAYNASTNIVGYTNTLTVSDEVGRYYYVDINKNKTNGSAEAGADPVFVRNCTSMVVVEDHIAEDGTFKAVVYDADGNQVTNTDSYTYTWYKTVSGTTNYVNDKDKVKTSNPGTFVSTYSSDNTGTSYTTSAYYSDSGKFTRNRGTSDKTSEYGGTLPDSGTYGLVRENFSEELQDVSDVFADANYEFNTNTSSADKFEITDRSGSLNDGSSCSVAVDEGQLRYYYVTVKIDDDTTYTSSYKYVKYSNQIENGGFQDYTNTNASSSAFEASIMPYWETTNKGYSESYKATSSTNEQYYRMHPLLEIGNYLSSTSYGTYGNYYSYPGLTYDKEDSTKIQTSTLDDYYEMGYDDDSTTDYVYSANQFCEINSTDCNTLYQTVMTIPDMPLYWSLTHHARTSTGKSTSIINDVIYQDENGANVTASSLGASSATVQVAIDVMYVVIMNETDAERLLSNGADQAAQQDIIDAMVLYITKNNDAQVMQTSEDGSSYLARYDGSYTYDKTEYKNISVWRVQTGSTKVEIKFGTDNDAKAAAKDTNLLAYYAEKYGTVKSYSYSSTSNNVTTYYAEFYTESETYSATYVIPNGQYVSRYFFVAGSSSNSVGAGSASSAYSDGGLTFGTYTDDAGETQTISDYNGVTKATNGTSNGNFIDNVVFSQQLDVTVNYWVYQPVEVTTTDENGNEVTTTEWKYILQTDDTEESKTMRGNTVTAGKAGDYYAKYNFTGSYVSVDGGDENTPTSVDEDGNSVLGTATSFKADGDNALVLDLYYSPYEISIDKTIVGLPEDMSYESFKDNMLRITIYALEEDGSGGYTKADSAVVDEYLEYNEKDESLTYSTGFILEKGTYLISETTYLLLTASFEGWDSVEMSLANGTLKLSYNDSLDGYILVVGEESDEADGDTDAEIEILLLNIYEPVAVQSTKSVLLGETKVEDINNGLGSTNPDSDTSLTYLSLTEYDDAKRSVDDTGYTEDSKRLGVLSGDTLTYRMELASTGRADSEDIVVTDTIPSGCTLQADSICILKQDRKDATNSYSVVKTILDSSDGGSTEDGVTTWSMTDNSGVSFKITYNKTTGEIEWNISEMDAYEQYYVEYAVIVDQIKSSTERELLTNTAKWTYLSKINSGETENSGTTVEVTMDMKAEEDNTTSGKYAYTVTFSDLDDYTVTELKDSLPDGFVIDTSTIEINCTSISDLTYYTLTYYKANGTELSGTLGTDYQASEIASFSVTYSDGISKSDDNKITLTFEGTQTETENAGEEIRNTAGISYVKTGGSTVYTSIVAYGNGVTNQVETDVTHLYIEVEKDIVSDANLTVDTASTDEEQTFLFVVKYYEEGSAPATDDAKSISYVEVNCESGKGSRLLQLDGRGTYVVMEVTDWSVTDYDYVSASLDGSATSSSNSSSVTIDYTTGGAYIEENGAFKTTLGLVKESHAVASFYNMESLYAYRSGQAYARNKMEDSD